MAAIKKETLFAILAGLAVVFVLYRYRTTKTVSGFSANDSMANGGEPVGMFASSQGAVSSGSALRETPESLLPRDQNSAWQSTPGGGSLQGINLLKPSDVIGINGRGNVLKNANLQLRSDPVIPDMKSSVGPWNQSTIMPDTMRAPFEIGTDCKM